MPEHDSKQYKVHEKEADQLEHSYLTLIYSCAHAPFYVYLHFLMKLWADLLKDTVLQRAGNI